MLKVGFYRLGEISLTDMHGLKGKLFNTFINKSDVNFLGGKVVHAFHTVQLNLDVKFKNGNAKFYQSIDGKCVGKIKLYSESVCYFDGDCLLMGLSIVEPSMFKHHDLNWINKDSINLDGLKLDAVILSNIHTVIIRDSEFYIMTNMVMDKLYDARLKINTEVGGDVQMTARELINKVGNYQDVDKYNDIITVGLYCGLQCYIMQPLEPEVTPYRYYLTDTYKEV